MSKIAMVPCWSLRPSTSCFPGCAISSPTVSTTAPTCPKLSPNSASGPSRSSNAPLTLSAFNCCRGAGSSNGPWLGSIATAAGDDVLAVDDRGVTQDAVGDEMRVLDEVGGVADHTRHQHLARRLFGVLPHPPFVLVAHIGGLEGIGLRLHLEDQIDDVLERQIMGVRAVPAAPAQVIAHAFLGNADERVIDRVDAPPGELAIGLDRGFGLQHIPPVR